MGAVISFLPFQKSSKESSDSSKGIARAAWPAGDVSALGRALARLIAEPQQRAMLGQAGALKVRREFSMEAGVDELAGRLAEVPHAAISARDEIARVSRTGT